MTDKEIAKLTHNDSAAVFGKPLKVIKRTAYQKDVLIIGFDTEYDSKTRKLYSAQFYTELDGKPKGKFYDLREVEIREIADLWAIVWDFCESNHIPLTQRKARKIYLVTFFSIAEAQHFGWDSSDVDIMDLGGLYEFATRINDPKVAVQELRMVDLQQFFRGEGLGSVAKSFGLQKLDADRKNVTWETIDDPEFQKYAIVDAEITYKVYAQLRAKYWTDYVVDIAKTKTPASTAMSIYRRHYLPMDVEPPPSYVRKQVLRSAWGGNNQCFIRGEVFGDTQEWDGDSMYPTSAIVLGRFPHPHNWGAVADLGGILDPQTIGGVCRVKFRFSEACRFPCLPIMVDGKLLYVLTGESNCTFEEVRVARRIDPKVHIDVVEAYGYRDGDPTLAQFMTDVKARKTQAGLDGDLVKRTLEKLNMNSCIGKFIQRVLDVSLNEQKNWLREFSIPVIPHRFREMVLDEIALRKGKPELVGQYDVIAEKFGDPLAPFLNLGAGWYPEFNALILGYARATIALAFHQNEAYLGTTDSLIMPGRLRETEINGIKFDLKKTGDNLLAIRTRLYQLREGETIQKAAWHGLHSKDAAYQMFADGLVADEFTYREEHIVKPKEAFRHGWEMGSMRIVEAARVSLGWDGKRKLIPSEDRFLPSVPWKNVDDFITQSSAQTHLRPMG